MRVRRIDVSYLRFRPQATALSTAVCGYALVMGKVFQYRQPTLSTMLANLNRHDYDAERFGDSLRSILGLIRKCTTRMKCLEEGSGEDEGDHLAEIAAQEEAMIDSLLGCAFVLCQTQVTAIAIGVVLASKRGLQIDSANSRKVAVKLGNGASQTVIAGIELAANYFKHNEEWMTERSGKGAQNHRVWLKTADVDKKGVPKNVLGRDTIEAAERYGLSPGDSKNMKTLAALLGVQMGDDYDGLPALAEKLRIWHEEMIAIVANAPKKP